LGVPAYRERLRLPLGWAVALLLVAGLAAAEVHGGAGGARAVLPYLLLLPGAVALVLVLSRPQVRVEDGVLHVPGARAPLTAFGQPEVLDASELRLWMGPRADSRAWVATRPWLRTGVRLPVVDPEDDTPYWLVGTRHPVALAEALL
jgi:hypothetical protein